MRAFLAINLDPPAQAQLARCLDTMQAAQPPMPLRWVGAASQHITLHFLGEIAPALVQDMQRLLPAVLGTCAPFTVTFERLGCFPHQRQPKVLWLGVSEPSGGLQQVHAALGTALTHLGCALDARPFTPHLTLARVPRLATPSQSATLGAWFSAQAPPAPHTMRVATVHLMHSELHPAGARYSPVLTCPLLGA